jgi:hypothetical protein
MHVGIRMTSTAAMAVLLLQAAAARAQTPQVTFVEVNDAVPGRFFNAAATVADPLDPNRLIIGFDTGKDPATWKANDFRASTAAFSHLSAMDTISFRIVPPEGYYISKVTYRQAGSGSIARTGKAAGGTHWVVGDDAAPVAMYLTNPDVTTTTEVKEYWQELPVSITAGLHAFSTPQLGSASLSVTEASVAVELTEIIPPPSGLEPLPVVEDPAPSLEDPAPPIGDPASPVEAPAPLTEDPAPPLE